ncbi:Alkaline phosphatase D [Halioglobus japonicus]|nr:Alkaline phosphatase D [Halioglobus japonicus]
MTTPPDFKRRSIVKALAASSLIPLLGSNLIACSNGSNNSNNDSGGNSIPAEFNHGVASGDPLTDRVILWTRVTPAEEGDVLVGWEVAADADFADIVAEGEGVTTAAVDYTVKVDAEGLQAGTAYYYRFMSGSNTSPTGKTRTLPSGTVAAASFAVVSCANYPAGFFNVYGELAKQDVDAVLHLGDYLYEYSSTGYASDRAEEFGRVVEPANEIISLSDYRTRYAQYHSDTDLQAAHAAHPFIVVWDDHEVANDSWENGAQNHNPETEGTFAARRMAAIQAWYEWLPVRPPATVDDIIYRRFQYGDLLDLLMLDTRHVGRDEQLQYRDFATGGIIDVDSVRAAATDTNRSILGSEQLGWLREQLTQSTARWQVLGQQVLMSRYQIPSPLLEALDPGISPELDLGKGTAALLAAVDAKGKAPEERTPEEQALLDSTIPYNLDAWDGYSAERDEILSFTQQMGSRLVALAGDTHNAWTSQLRTSDGEIAGVEFGCTSVSSPGFDGPDLLGPANAGLFGPLVTGLIDDLVYANLAGRGYLHLTFSADNVTATHRFITTVDSKDYAVNEAATKSFVVNRADMLLS